MPYAAQVFCHLAAAEERVQCVFGVDLPQKSRFQLIRVGWQMRRIEGGTGNTRQFTLFGQRQGVLGV